MATVFVLLCLPGICLADGADLVKSSGVRGGIVVHLGCGDGEQTAAMLLGDSYLVHGLDTDKANVAKARKHIRSKGLYGRVSVAKFDGRNLPYADNTVNLIVADTLGNVPAAEAMRVLAPLGAMVVGGKKTVKPWPKEIDDWPQYLNKADNNAVAKDSVAGPPRHVQWVDSPTWCRSHMGIPTIASMVSGNGRLFSIEDTSPPDNPFLPSSFRLVARDAFNGKELWSRDITRWEAVTMYIKCQPVQQQRRMAVVGDTLYCTMQLEGPLSAVDAATGETVKVYKNTDPVQEVAYADGILYLNVGDRFPTAAYNIVKTKGRPFVEGVDPDGPFHGGGFKEGYAPEIKDKEKPVSSIVALDPKSGKELWAIHDIDNYTGASLAIQGDHVVYQAAGGLYCVNSKTGKRIWAIQKPVVNAVGHDSFTPGTTPNTVVIADGKVFAIEVDPDKRSASTAKGTVSAYSLDDGKLLWQAPSLGNYEASCDLCYVNGTLWVGGHNPTQYNVETGEPIKKIVQKMTGPMGHDRCYRNLITERFFINSKTGGADFLDLETSTEFPHHWTRGGCGMGVLPANGLVYSTPYSCTCSMGAMFQGMNAYAAEPGLKASDQPVEVERSPRLEKGPAYGKIKDATPAADDDWPAYRRDGSRSGITEAAVPAKMSVRWEAKLPSTPSALTIAAGKVFACDPDSHTLHALDAATGKPEWTFTADGRIDSPPTYHKGMLLFGSRDGWVYCLRATDGALAWRFKDLPDKLIGAFGQLESAWPIAGSVVILDDNVYAAAGRCSYLDGGIFLYKLDPENGELLKSRACYGPFAETTGFPIGGHAGFKNDILVTDGTNLYLRQKAFDRDLADASGGRHIVASGGFLDGEPQHRTCWSLSSTIGKSSADILVSDGENCYEVQGFPLWHNHSYFDPRKNGYTLLASTFGAAAAPAPKASPVPAPAASPEERRTGKKGKGRRGAAREKAKGQKAKSRGGHGQERWRTNIAITGKAMAAAGDVLFVAGEPMKFDDPSYKNYVAAYNGKLGGRLLAVSATDGKPLAEYRLKAAPVWDSLAIAGGHLFISLADGTVQCLGPPAKTNGD